LARWLLLQIANTILKPLSTLSIQKRNQKASSFAILRSEVALCGLHEKPETSGIIVKRSSDRKAGVTSVGYIVKLNRTFP
jgi:hypothetical protein